MQGRRDGAEQRGPALPYAGQQAAGPEAVLEVVVAGARDVGEAQPDERVDPLGERVFLQGA